MSHEMEMPTPCERCGEVFDLNDGRVSPRSKATNTRIVICEQCAEVEEEEIEREEEIEQLRFSIESWEHEIADAKTRLRELGAE